MSKQKLTPWFPADVKPVHVGWYQRDYGICAEKFDNDYWDGYLWRFSEKGHVMVFQYKKWRGLAEQPK